jgi:hypothetical protein
MSNITQALAKKRLIQVAGRQFGDTIAVGVKAGMCI